jgi:phosphohistidine phosphatase
MPTQLYLIRHGIAANPNDYGDDRDRPLTAKGQAKTKAVAARLKELGLQFDEIFTSPLLRAQQTAEILLQANLSGQMTIAETLAPRGSFSNWLNERATQLPAVPQTLALVGHEPDLSQWAELLVWGEVQGVLVLKKAGIIGIELPDTTDPVGNSLLIWLTPPRFLL